jgi:TolB-like protein/tRNA A-37 threonylcarbamoyl transferase component Bud32/Tfp pilus assembly protein PilF
MIRKTISHYRILDKLGEGGMGVVYKAEDTKLKRVVALKFLHPELTREDEAKTRFMHEAQAAASLNHPNICTIYEIDEHEGQSFIAMELLEGEELKDRIAKGPLPIDEAISVALAIGEGLREAHDKGIIHRDVKPGNIMLTARSQAKLLDFGLARLGELSKITKTDTTLGTAAYMSPEQASAIEVDRRTDIWSLGVILYELVAGQRPFVGQYEAAVVHSILNDEPEPLTSRRSNVPLELERIVRKALAKNPSERYQHVEDMLVDLRGLRQGTETSRISPQAKKRRIGRAALIAGAVVIAVASIAFFETRHMHAPGGPSRKEAVPEHRKMIVVLPFENLGAPEDEYFANGTTDAITTRLTGVTGLGVISRQSAMQYKKTTKSIRQIGKELGVDYILEGTVQREKPGDPASRVRVMPQLVRVADDTNVWAETYDQDMTQVFRVQSDIAERVAAQMDVALLEPERRAIEKKSTENLDAYDDYLRGMNYVGSEDLPDMELCVELFQKAVKSDPQFAEAWAGLAAAYQNLYWVFDRPGMLSLATEAAREAERLAPDLPETHIALGHSHYVNYEFEKALAQYETAQRLRPGGDAERNIGYALRRLGRWEEALGHFENASKLMPRDAAVFMDCLGMTEICMRRFDAAERDLNRSIALAPRSPGGYYFKARCLLARNGDVDSATQVNAEMLRRTGSANMAMSVVVQVFDWMPEMALFPDFYATVFDAFEAGPIDRFRAVQPAMVATTHLARAVIYEAKADPGLAAARYDSARVCYERIIRSNPESAYIPFYHSALGLACAGLGRKAEAVREGETAVRMRPISKDAIFGTELVWYLAMIYVKCGENEKAIDQLEFLLSIPSFISPGLLRVDPFWKPLRDNPRFRRLAELK